MLEFEYFKTEDADNFAFYRIPKVLFTDRTFRKLSCEAKVVYGLIERCRRGQGKVNITYVKSFVQRKCGAETVKSITDEPKTGESAGSLEGLETEGSVESCEGRRSETLVEYTRGNQGSDWL